MITGDYKKTQRACHCSYLAMSSVFCFPPMLFLTFHENYGISYTLLGTLVLANFCTQLLIDLIFSFFSKHFRVRIAVRVMPLFTSLGLVIYALAPILFPGQVYLGLLLGTILFSIASGLSEVLLSPLIAAIPGSTAKDMSLLHALFAVGFLCTVGISTLFFHLFGMEHWQILTFFWASLPLLAALLFCLSPIPTMNLSHVSTKNSQGKQTLLLALCIACIFLGSAAENTMTNWISSYLETALGLDKTLGDLLGMALFAFFLGLGRILHARSGRSIFPILLLGMTGAAISYLVAGLSHNPLIALLACIFTGLCVSMLWPGSLILMEERMTGAGVASYALMAAGGDFGASVAPQLLGAVVDRVSTSTWAQDLSVQISLTPEQIGMKAGMLVAALFPLLGIGVLLYMRRIFKSSVSS